MATNRFGYSDDFVLNNGKVGINSASPQEKLDVVSVVKGDRLKVAGVSSFTVYEGFLNSTQNIVEGVYLNSGNGITGSLSGEVIVGTGITVTIGEPATSVQNYIESLKVYNTFTVPVGGTTDRPTTEKPGQLFFNRDFGTIEFWDGDRWRQVDNTTRSGRGVFMGGGNPSFGGYTNNIDYVNISTTGNALNFGTLSTSNRHPSGCSSSIRGVIYLGYIPAGFTNVIEYLTIASEGNSIDFGDLNSDYRYSSASCSSSSRGLIGGGYDPSSFNNTINYIEISTLGNSLDFGDLMSARSSVAALSSPTRGLFAGGSPVTNTIDTVTIASTGNAVSFGSLIVARGNIAGCSNGTRGVFGGGYFYTSPSSIISYNVSEYVTIASNGNSTYFGDLTFSGGYKGATSSRTRGVFAGGTGSINVIDYVTIATTGNALDFGDLTLGRYNIAACSDSHGGLGGF